MKRFSAAALVAFVLIGPIGALAGAPPIPPPAPLSLPLSTAKGGTGNSTGAADSLTVGGTSLAQRFGHVFNLMDDGGALGDGQYSTVTATIGSGSTSLSVSSSTFSSSDVPAGCAPGTTSSCKTIGITGAGGAQTTGRITAGQTLLNSPLSISARTRWGFSYQYSATNSTWYRLL